MLLTPLIVSKKQVNEQNPTKGHKEAIVDRCVY